MPTKVLYIVTRVDLENGKNEVLTWEPDADLARLTFQSACMDVNSVVPTPILLEKRTETEDRFVLELINACILIPGRPWVDKGFFEGEYREAAQAIHNLQKIIHGYTLLGEQTLNDDNQPVTEDDDAESITEHPAST